MATGWYAWTCLLLAAATPGAEDVVHLNHRGFQIPIKIKPEHAKDIREVILYASHDLGRTWRISSRTTPDKSAFDFVTHEDGTYYFGIAVTDQRGNLDPPDIYKAPVGLKVAVDTVKPAVQITSATRSGDDVQVTWEVKEDRPDWATMKMEYQAGQGQWVPLGIATGERGSYRFRPPVPGDVKLRLTLRDLAGNEGTAEKMVAGPAGHLDRAVVGAGGVVPPPTMRVEGPAPVGDLPPPPLTGDPGPRDITPSPAGGHSASPSATASAATGPLPPLRIVSKREVKLGFDVSKIGPSGLGTVDVYVTEDDGRSWTKSPAGPDLVLPPPGESAKAMRGSVTVTLGKDAVRYGYYLVLKSRAGLAKPGPQPGTAPQVRVELDTTLPDTKLYAPESDASRRDSVLLRWEATDRNLASNPVTLEWATSPGGPWTPIGDAQLPNTGKFSWAVTPNVPVKVYLKLTVRDTAGNTAVAQTDQPVLIDVTTPELGNVTLEPGR